MAFKHKFTYEEKVKIVSEYIDGTYGFREICKRYDINQGSLGKRVRPLSAFEINDIARN